MEYFDIIKVLGYDIQPLYKDSLLQFKIKIHGKYKSVKLLYKLPSLSAAEHFLDNNANTIYEELRCIILKYVENYFKNTKLEVKEYGDGSSPKGFTNIISLQDQLIIAEGVEKSFAEEIVKRWNKTYEDGVKDAATIAGTYCWERSLEGSKLKSPAVFTSHTWQKIQNHIFKELDIKNEI